MPDCGSDEKMSQTAFVNTSTAPTDFWKRGPNGEVIRVHQIPRYQKFTPVGMIDCPVDLRELGVHRMTERRGFGVDKDYWVGTLAHAKFPELWTGQTCFYLRKKKEEV